MTKHPRRGSRGSLHLLVELDSTKQVRRVVRLDVTDDGFIVLVDANPQRLGQKRERRFAITTDALISAIAIEGVALGNNHQCPEHRRIASSGRIRRSLR